MTLMPTDPKRWKDGRSGDGDPEDRAGALVQKMGEPALPDETALARVRVRLVAAPRGAAGRLAWRAAAALAVLGATAALAFTAGRQKSTRLEPRVSDVRAPHSDRLLRRLGTSVGFLTTPSGPWGTMPVREIDVLRRAPAPLLERLRAGRVDDEGFAVGNRKGFRCSGEQRFAIDRMVLGAALASRELIADGWRAVDTTFRFQHAEGHFLDGAVCVAYWLAHLSHALLVLNESELAADYQNRIAELLPKIESAATWLLEPSQLTTLERASERFPSRMFYFGTALGLTGRLLGHGQLETIGREFVDRGLREQREDGSFAHEPPLDAIYQGSILWRLSWYALRFPDPKVDEALRRGGAWQMERVTEGGVLQMSRPDPAARLVPLPRDRWNVLEVAWALLYHGARFDPAALHLAAAARDRRHAVVRTDLLRSADQRP